jgi:hypothetical protein
VAEKVVESRPGSEDPDAVNLMFKLAQRSRERWPSQELAGPYARPGLVPEQA